MVSTDSSSMPSPAAGKTPARWWRRHWLPGFFLIIILPNALWSVANLLYNDKLIVEGFGNAEQKDVFWQVGFPLYTTLSWVVGLAICAWLVHPLRLYFAALDGKRDMTPVLRERAQRRLVNLPAYQLLCNFFLWVPGGIYFPVLLFTLGSTYHASAITVQFVCSFLVSAVVATFQTFVLLERFLVNYLYADVFTDRRPGQVKAAIPLPFRTRLWLLWGAVSLGPMIVLLLVTIYPIYKLSLLGPEQPTSELYLLTAEVVLFSIVIGAIIFQVVGADLASWLESHMHATREIAAENFDYRITQLRSDEWGNLTDSVNAMALDLSKGRHLHETFGRFVGPEVRDEILKRFTQLGGNVQVITVMFADIRGFTSRAAGRAPEEVVELLNRFLTLGVQAVEETGGWVNKFLGDGFMALFGTPLPRAEHADLAVTAACDLIHRLEALNNELRSQGQAPLKIGIGINSGPALVGCIGATVTSPEGKPRMRLEFTAIGETVNLTQRIEELTKTCGETLLISEATRDRLQRPVKLACVGAQSVRGAAMPITVYRLDRDAEC